MENSNSYVSTKTIKATLGVHQQTLYYWERQGKIETIRTPGGQRLYNLKKYLEEYGNESLEKAPKEEKIRKKLKKK